MTEMEPSSSMVERSYRISVGDPGVYFNDKVGQKNGKGRLWINGYS